MGVEIVGVVVVRCDSCEKFKRTANLAIAMEKKTVSELGQSFLYSRCVATCRGRLENRRQDDKTTRTKQREPWTERVHGIQDDSNVGAGVGAVDEGPGSLRRLELADENLRGRRPATLEERDEIRFREDG